jgi:UDP-N-acetylmuramyl pentapeptide synthase
MAELGSRERELHREIGQYALDRCDELLTLGPLARQAAAVFGSEGRFFDDIGSLSEALEALLADDVTVLVKGSRVMGLDHLVNLLRSDHESSEVPTC